MSRNWPACLQGCRSSRASDIPTLQPTSCISQRLQFGPCVRVVVRNGDTSGVSPKDRGSLEQSLQSGPYWGRQREAGMGRGSCETAYRCVSQDSGKLEGWNGSIFVCV